MVYSKTRQISVTQKMPAASNHHSDRSIIFFRRLERARGRDHPGCDHLHAVLTHGLPNEGVWQPSETGVWAGPSMYVEKPSREVDLHEVDKVFENY